MNDIVTDTTTTATGTVPAIAFTDLTKQYAETVVLGPVSGEFTRGGVTALADLGRAPSVVSGVVTSSPLATAEARRALDVPVAGTFDLTEAEVADILGATIGPALHRLARGVDDRPVAENAPMRSSPASTTTSSRWTPTRPARARRRT